MLAPIDQGAAMNRFLTDLIALAALAAVAGSAVVAPRKLSDLQWMTGTWRNADGNEQREERWMLAAG